MGTYESKEITTKVLPLAEVEDAMVFTYMCDVGGMVSLRWKTEGDGGGVPFL